MNDHMTVARRFGRNLTVARKQTGMSQEEVGFRAGMNRAQIGVMERGERCPRIDTLVKLAAALEVPITCPLLDGIGWRSAIAELGSFDASPSDVDESSSDV